MMPDFTHSAVFTAKLDQELQDFLIRPDGDEDLLFALWTPSQGSKRLTGIVHTPIWPVDGDRQRHGNVSFNPAYFERALEIALSNDCGLAFLHSHPISGWQNMSHDDVIAERRMSGPVATMTDHPLLGLTVGSDGTWSARFWKHDEQGNPTRQWCESVRTIGQRMRISFTDELLPKPSFAEAFKRTVTVWGKKNHADLARLRIGIVGLGSVGSIVAETLARMGMTRFVLIDFDEVQRHNLDRLLGAVTADIGELKVDIAARQITGAATAESTEIEKIPFSIAEAEGYAAALNCDVIFSCVDRPRARRILNHLAYSHLIPVVDGGIAVWFRDGEFSGVDWQLQTVGPERPCLECLNAYDPADVALEADGQLDNPSYLKGLPENHRFKRNENVFPFSANLASLEVLQLVALVTEIAGISSFGVQRYRYVTGQVEFDLERQCRPDCEHVALEGQGDRHFSLVGKDFAAIAARERQGK